MHIKNNAWVDGLDGNSFFPRGIKDTCSIPKWGCGVNGGILFFLQGGQGMEAEFC